MTKLPPLKSKSEFESRIAELKAIIDEDIASYSQVISRSTLKQFTPYSAVAVDAFLSVLARGGKRIRGALTIEAYEMMGGTNKAMILQAARAVEMVHAYILILDDIMDRSTVRRGDDSAHIMLAKYHEKHKFADESLHFGESIAMNAALIGNHAAQTIVANLDADPELVVKAVSILNRSLVITGHGQINDMFNEVVGEVDESAVDRVLEWKTAHYTFLHPLHFGMVLAGADCAATDAITEYAMNAGRVFQITDDILGTFGEEFESGKSPLDDIKEGKRTLLTTYALEHADSAGKNFLIQMLGNHQLNELEFRRAKEILVQSGALDYAKTEAKISAKKAQQSLQNESIHWSKSGTNFLSQLINYLLVRHA